MKHELVKQKHTTFEFIHESLIINEKFFHK